MPTWMVCLFACLFKETPQSSLTEVPNLSRKISSFLCICDCNMRCLRFRNEWRLTVIKKKKSKCWYFTDDVDEVSASLQLDLFGQMHVKKSCILIHPFCSMMYSSPTCLVSLLSIAPTTQKDDVLSPRLSGWSKALLVISSTDQRRRDWAQSGATPSAA